MKQLVIAWTILALALCAAPALARDISGTYNIKGVNPDGKGAYEGRARVARSGESYKVMWSIGSQVMYGTGILMGHGFAVIYGDSSQKVPSGLVLYGVKKDGSLDGRFTSFGGTRLGREIWRPAKAE